MRPFLLDRGIDGKVRLLGYSGLDGAGLRDHAQTYAPPEVWSAADWASLATKPMPSAWRVGSPLHFRTRVCPVVRVSAEGPHARAGSEVDAWIAAARNAPGEPVDREVVYRGWLEDAVTRAAGARVVDARLVEFRVERALRRSQGPERRSSLRPKPAATMEGTLEVTDGAAFHAMLRRGLGRHRAFGHGMILLTRW